MFCVCQDVCVCVCVCICVCVCVTGLKYEDEVIDDIKKRTGVPEDKLDKPLKKVRITC